MNRDYNYEKMADEITDLVIRYTYNVRASSGGEVAADQIGRLKEEAMWLYNNNPYFRNTVRSLVSQLIPVIEEYAYEEVKQRANCTILNQVPST